MIHTGAGAWHKPAGTAARLIPADSQPNPGGRRIIAGGIEAGSEPGQGFRIGTARQRPAAESAPSSAQPLRKERDRCMRLPAGSSEILVDQVACLESLGRADALGRSPSLTRIKARRAGIRRGRRARSRRAVRSPSADRRASLLIAGVPVVVPEDVVDAIGIGRVIGRGGEWMPGGAPTFDPALNQRDRSRGNFREIGGGQRSDLRIVGEHDNAAGAQNAGRQAIETRTDRPDRAFGVSLAIRAARHDRNCGGVALVEPMRRLGRADRRDRGQIRTARPLARLRAGRPRSRLRFHRERRHPTHLLQPVRGHDRAGAGVVHQHEAGAAGADPAVDRLHELAALGRYRSRQVPGGISSGVRMSSR